MAGWQQLLSNLVTSAMWPLALLLVVWIFRDPIKMLVERIKAAEVLGNKFEFRENVERLDQLADRVGIEQAGKTPDSTESDLGESDRRGDQEAPAHPGQTADQPRYTYSEGLYVGEIPRPLEYLTEVAEISPAAAIVDAWREVERKIREYWEAIEKVRNLPPLRRPGSWDMIRALWGNEITSADQVELLDSLRKTRNSVAHGETQPSVGQSLTYVEAAETAIQALDADIANINSRQH